MEFQIQTSSNHGLAAIFGPQAGLGTSVDHPELPVRLVLRSTPGHGFGFGEVASVLIECAPGAVAGIPAGLLANWLFAIFKGNVRRIESEDSVFQVSESHLEMLVRRILAETERQKADSNAPPPADKRRSRSKKGGAR